MPGPALAIALTLFAADPPPDPPLAGYGSLASFQALDCIEDWMQLCSPPAHPWLSVHVHAERVEVTPWEEDHVEFRIVARSATALELAFARCDPERPACDLAGKGATARLELRPAGRTTWHGPSVERLLEGDAGGVRARQRVELIDNRQYNAWVRELERRYVPKGECGGLASYEPVGGKPCLNAPGKVSLTPARREQQAAREPGQPCDAVSSIRVMPFRSGEATSDRAYAGLVAAGCAVVPCLVERIVDTREMPDPRQAPIVLGFTVGDAALFMASELTDRSYEESLPKKVRARIPDEGVYAYFRFVETRANRVAIRADWRRWLVAHPGCR